MKWKYVLFWLLSVSLLYSQSNADSLLRILPTLKEDSIKVQVYLDLVNEYYRNDIKTAMGYAIKAEELSEKAGLTLMLAKARRNTAYMLTNLREYRQAQEKYETALMVFYELDDQSGIIDVKTELGKIARMQSKNEVAFKLFFEALTLAKTNDDKNREAIIYSAIGGVYKNQKQYKKAGDNYEAALALVRELDIKPGISACLTNLGNIYIEIREFRKAIRYHEQALELKKETRDKLGEARVLNSLGIVYNNLGEYITAENYLRKAFELANEVDDVNLGYEIEYGWPKQHLVKATTRKA